MAINGGQEIEPPLALNIELEIENPLRLNVGEEIEDPSELNVQDRNGSPVPPAPENDAHEEIDINVLPAPENDVDASPPKRKVRNATTKQQEAKRAHNLGIAHISLRGKNVPARVMREGSDASCKRNCMGKFTNEQRQKIHDAFWKSGDHQTQWIFLSSLVKTSPVKRRTGQAAYDQDPKRNVSNKYYLKVGVDEIQVCLKMFLDTFTVSSQFVQTALQKTKRGDGLPSPDKKGKYVKKRVVSTIITENVKAHIKKYPRVPSHYTRKRSSYMYLDPHLNMTVMYRMYKTERGNSPHTATLRQYRDVFNTYKIKFLKPKKDQCGVCLAYKYKREKTPEDTQKYEEHYGKSKRNQAIRQAQCDAAVAKAAAGENSTECVATFDLQSVLSTPKSENGDFFYKSKLNCYNFTIFESGSQQAYNYVWDQTIANRGSNEIVSFLYDFITLRYEQGVRAFYFWSDNCYGQNKNRSLFSLYHLLCSRLHIKIVHRYLIKGHTYMTCDSVHATIERQARKAEIFTPSEWYALIKASKKQSPLYIVKQVKQDSIFDMKELAKHLNWAKFPVSKIEEICLDWEKPGVASFKRDLDGPASTVSILKRQRGGQVNWKTCRFQQAYSGPILLRARVLTDLKWFCNKGYIPPASLPFYNNLFQEQAGAHAGTGADANEPDGDAEADDPPDNCSVSSGGSTSRTDNESADEDDNGREE